MHLPGPVRAAVGLVATAADEARRLPDRAVELPMLAVSTALQMSLRAQQRYARLAARGDEALAGRAGDEPPPWATFDEPVTAAGAATSTEAEDRRDARALLDDMFGAAPADGAPAAAPAPAGRTVAATKAAAAKKAVATKKTAAAKKAAAKKAALVRKSAATKAAAKTAAAKRAVTKAAAAAEPAVVPDPVPPATPVTDPGKSVHAPRHTAPSRFDTVDVPAETDDGAENARDGD